MTKLDEILAQARTKPDSVPDLEITYERGHEMSGTVRFVVRGGAYTLDSNVTANREPKSWSGQLTPAQYGGLVALLADTRAIDAPKSTRNIGDGEQPIQLAVHAQGQAGATMIWNDDAVKLDGFHRFEEGLLALAKQLSGGAVLAEAQ